MVSASELAGGTHPAGPRGVKQIPCLSARECDDVLSKVNELRRWWRVRDELGGYNTLGASSYLDARAGRFTNYEQLANEDNLLLREHFGDVLGKVREVLSTALGATCEYHPRLAMPGFHVFESRTELPPAHRHTDQQHLNIPWNDLQVEVSATDLSFTLPVALPQTKAGLNVWIREPVNENLEVPKYSGSFHRYRKGDLVLLNGGLPHQIANLERMAPTEMRVTLQGHAVSTTTSSWILYW